MNNRVLQTLKGLRDRLQIKTDSLTKPDYDILNKATGLIAELERMELNSGTADNDRTVALTVVLGDVSVQSKPNDITVKVFDFTRADADPEYQPDIFPAVTLTKLEQEDRINAHREDK